MPGTVPKAPYNRQFMKTGKTMKKKMGRGGMKKKMGRGGMKKKMGY